MAKKNVSADFNSFAGRIVNAKEVHEILEADLKASKPKGIARVLNVATSIAVLPVNLVLMPVRVAKTLKNVIRYSEHLPKDQTQTYVRKEKEADALAAIANNTDTLKSNRQAVEKAVGAENIYTDAQILMDITRIGLGSMGGKCKKISKGFADAVTKATDYSDEVKSGEIVALPLRFGSPKQQPKQ